jgi:LuxR family maltose regulon positive regulatory protein
VRRWLAAVGEERVATDPSLALTAAWIAALSGEREEWVRWTAIAARSEGSTPVRGGYRSLESGSALMHVFGYAGLQEMLTQGRRAAELETDPASPWHAVALLLFGWSLYLLGDLQAARPCLEEAASLSRQGSPIVQVSALSVLSLILCDQGRREEAERLAREARQVVDDHGLAEVPQSSFVHTALGRALAAQGRLPEAAAELDRGLQLRRSAPELSIWPTVEHLLTHAPVRAALGDGEGARALLDEARTLLADDPDAQHLRARLARVEGALEGAGRRRMRRGDPLSEAEQAVLRLLVTDLSRREIAGQLYLSPNTISSHIRTIFRKLGVTSREEAVAHATADGLLSGSEAGGHSGRG